MGIAICTTAVLIVFIVCAFITYWMYMDFCNDNKIKMFADQKHEERIKKLEKQMEELKKE